MATRPKLVGLTGGIASGKSTVAGFLRDEGVPVLDADKLGRLAMARDGEAYEPVVEAFGEEILDEAGEIDREKLGRIVFGDEKARRRLEAITHPAIGRLSARGIDLIAERGEPLAVYEAALLVETGIHTGLDALVVVSCSLAAQLGRVVARDGLTPEAAAARIASQLPLAEKLKVADFVIENDGSLEQTRAETIAVLAALRARLVGAP